MLIDNGSDSERLAPLARWAREHDAVELATFPSEVAPAPTLTNRSLIVVRTGENRGYSGGNNVAFRWAHTLGFGWILVLNNDTCVPADLLAGLVQTGSTSPEVGMVGCRVVPLGDTRAPTYEGGRLLYHLGVYAMQRFHGRRGDVEVNFVPGCCVLMRTAMLNQIGFLDERYFLYSEDIELSYRALKTGWRLLLNLEVQVAHALSTSLGGPQSASYYYYVTRNTLIFIKERLRGPQRPISFVFFVLQALARCLVWSLTGRFRKVTAAAAGARDFVAGRTGPRPIKVVHG